MLKFDSFDKINNSSIQSVDGISSANESKEEYKEYPYHQIVVKVNNRNEYDELEKRLKELVPITHELDISNYPNYIFINPNQTNHNNRMRLVYLGINPNERSMKEFIFNDFRVNHNIFELSDWKKIEHIIKFGTDIKTPNLLPKTFLYESLDINDLNKIRVKKESVFIVPQSKESTKELIDILENKAGLRKLYEYMTDTELDDFDFNGTNILVFFIYYNDDTPGYSCITVSKENFAESSALSNTLFLPKDKALLMRFLHITPNLQPKKFIFESNNYKNFPDRYFVVKVNNREELTELLNEISDLDIVHKINRDDILETTNGFPNYIFINPNKINMTNQATLMYLGNKPNQDTIQRFVYDDREVNSEILNVSEWGKIKDLIIYGRDRTPNLQPKKFIYESNNDLLLESTQRYNNLKEKMSNEHIFIMVDKEESAKELNNYIKNVWKLNFHSYSSEPIDRIRSWEFGPDTNIAYGFEISRDSRNPNPKTGDFSYAYKDINKSQLNGLPGDINRYFYNYETEFYDIIKPVLDNLFIPKPNLYPKKFIYESKENKVLHAFDMDDTLVYAKRFEEYIKPMLIREYLTPEIIMNNKLEDIGIGIEKLKYEDGRIYFDDPNQDYKIPSGSSWVRKKDRIYIIQPDAYFMTDESMPIGTYDDIVDLYNNAENKCIITARNERLRNQTVRALKDLGVEKPNMGLFMYPINSFSYTYEYKSNKLLELYKTLNFNEIHYYDDNIKLLKKIKNNLQGKDINIKFYKVTKNRVRQL